MRVQLTTDRAGLHYTDSDGDIIDVPEDEARRLLSTGQAIPVEVPVVETTMEAPDRLPAAPVVVETTMGGPSESLVNRRPAPSRTPKARR